MHNQTQHILLLRTTQSQSWNGSGSSTSYKLIANEKLQFPGKQVAILTKLSQQLDVESEKVLTMGHGTGGANLAKFIRAKHAFQDNAGVLLGVVNTEIDGLAKLQAILNGNKSDDLGFGSKVSVEQNLLIPQTYTETDEEAVTGRQLAPPSMGHVDLESRKIHAGRR